MANLREVLLLNLQQQSFFDNAYNPLINALSKVATLKRAKTRGGALRYLETNTPAVLFVTDEGLSKIENRAVFEKVLNYVQSGGLVIVGLHMPNFTNMDEFDK